MKIGNINQEELIEAIKNKDEVLISDIESQYIDVVTDKFKEVINALGSEDNMNHL